MRKPAFCVCENKDADPLRGNIAKLISAFVFTIRIVRSLYYLNPKCQASSHLLWLYRPVCVGPGRNPRRPVFSERGSTSNGLFYTWTVLKVSLLFRKSFITEDTEIRHSHQHQREMQSVLRSQHMMELLSSPPSPTNRKSTS